MHLKKLEILGFKSFADKTVVHFEQGITCVVGPNGCGKSNLADAIRWALGSRSPKNLRAGKMEDVIFSGTEFRKPLNLAEVTLTFDNGDKTLPLDFQDVAITRRLYRTGESEYLINKTACRYKDIQELIMDTGLGTNAYSMIEQGKIDYILNAEDDEKRFLIEEAAGIAKFKMQKQEALRKLERTEGNLLRLNDITSEVEKNIKYSERQAKKAEQYREKYDRLKELEIKKARLEIRSIEDEKTGLSEKCISLETAVRDLGLECAQIQEELVRVEEHLGSVEKKRAEVEASRYEKRLRISQLEEQMNARKSRMTDLEDEIQTLENETVLGVGRLEALHREIERKQQELETCGSELENHSSRHEKIDSEYGMQKAIYEQQNEQTRAMQAKLYETQDSIARVKARLLALDASRDNQESRIRKSQELGSRLLNQKDESLSRLNESREHVSLRDQLDSSAIQKVDVDNRFNEIETQIRQIESEAASLDGQRGEMLKQKQFLEELEEQGVFEAEVSRNVIRESLKSQDTITKPVKSLWDVIIVEKEYRLAMRAAFAEWFHSVVVESESHAAEVLSFACKIEAKVISVLMPNEGAHFSETAVPVEGYRSRAIDLVQIRPGYEGLVESLLQNVIVVESYSLELIASWLRAAEGFMIVTMDGYLISPGKKIRYFGDSSEAESISIKNDIEQLVEKIAHAENMSLSYRTQLEALGKEKKTIKEESIALASKLLELRVQSESAGKVRESIQLQLHSLEEEIRNTETDCEHSHSEIQRIDAEKDTLANEMGNLEASKQDYEKSANILSVDLTRLSSGLEELTKAVAQSQQKLERWKDQVRYLTDSLEILSRNEVTGIEEQKKRIEKKESNKEIIKQLQEDQRSAVVDSEVARAELENFMEEACRVETEHTAAITQKKHCDKTLADKKRLQDESKEDLHLASMAGQEISHRVERIANRLKDVYKLEVDLFSIPESVDSNDDGAEISLEELEIEMELLRKKLDNLGTVNLLAIDEYDALKERFDFLSTQKADLEKAREELLEAIRKINKTTKILFEETFQKVRTSFKRYFKILFGGGEAELLLQDEKNPLDSGIDIMARPVGKKLQKLTLLSGGEKALTATALIFALFSVKPSPFCLLDEVDAPLDEANVDRFLVMVKEFMDSTQFVVVTHNRKTIASGSTLYGVTMQEPGVSKIVSVRLGDQQQEDKKITKRNEDVQALHELLSETSEV